MNARNSVQLDLLRQLCQLQTVGAIYSDTCTWMTVNTIA